MLSGILTQTPWVGAIGVIAVALYTKRFLTLTPNCLLTLAPIVVEVESAASLIRRVQMRILFFELSRHGYQVLRNKPQSQFHLWRFEKQNLENNAISSTTVRELGWSRKAWLSRAIFLAEKEHSC